MLFFIIKDMHINLIYSISTYFIGVIAYYNTLVLFICLLTLS